MVKGWLTGTDIMEQYGKAAVEIGQACYDDVLHAFTADVLEPVFEESKLPHIPLFPPAGVNPLDHVQYTAFTYWDWSDHLYKDTEPEPQYKDLKMWSFADEIGLDITKLNKEAIEVVYRKAIEKRKLPFKVTDECMAVAHLMEHCYAYLQTGAITTKSRTMCFLYPVFYKWYKYFPGKESCDESEPAEEYKRNIASMWFKEEEVKAWLAVPTESIGGNETTADNFRADKATVEQHITAWSAILPDLRGRELASAKLAIEKWRGLNHIDAYKAAFPDGQSHEPTGYVGGLKKEARRVAERYGLTMPKWSR